MTYPATFELSTTDNLTGLLNPAYFRHLLREELLTQAQTNSEPLSLFLFDLDNFLEVNKTYERQAGDEVLLVDSRMITKTSHYTATQLERLGHLAKTIKRNEASLLREGLDDLLKKYNDRLGLPPKQ